MDDKQPGNAAKRGPAIRIVKDFYWRMLSLAALAFVLSGFAQALHHDLEDLPFTVLYIGLVFGLINLAGARWMIAPFVRYQEDRRVAQLVRHRLRSLPLLAAAWTVVLTLVTVYVALYVERLACAGCALDDLPTGALLSLLGPAFAYSSLVAVFAYFITSDYACRLSFTLQDEYALEVKPGKGHLGAKLFFVFAAVTLLPAGLLAFEGYFQTTLGAVLRIAPTWTFKVNLLASVLLTLCALIFVLRSFTFPIINLARAAARIGGGHLDTRAPVVSDDELGRLAGQFNTMAGKLADREFLRETFGRFVPSAVANVIIRDRAILRPQVGEATIVFSDIEGFTSLSEQLEPVQILTLLNQYFALAGDAIDRYGGVITQFQGDAILAVFNLPVTNPDHAANAVRAALLLQRATANMDAAAGGTLRTRVGINTGTIVGGTVGGAHRLGYTVHGDDVNLAARLEELNKDYGTYLLVSGRTMTLARDSFSFRSLGQAPIRGRRHGVSVYTLDQK